MKKGKKTRKKKNHPKLERVGRSETGGDFLHTTIGYLFFFFNSCREWEWRIWCLVLSFCIFLLPCSPHDPASDDLAVKNTRITRKALGDAIQSLLRGYSPGVA